MHLISCLQITQSSGGECKLTIASGSQEQCQYDMQPGQHEGREESHSVSEFEKWECDSPIIQDRTTCLQVRMEVQYHVLFSASSCQPCDSARRAFAVVPDPPINYATSISFPIILHVTQPTLAAKILVEICPYWMLRSHYVSKSLNFLTLCQLTPSLHVLHYESFIYSLYETCCSKLHCHIYVADQKIDSVHCILASKEKGNCALT